MSSLRLLRTVDTTAVKDISITDIFTTDFNLYKIVSSNLKANNSTASGTNLRLINSNGSVIADNYHYAQRNHKANTSFSWSASTDESRIWNVFGGIDDGGQASGSVAYIMNPTDNSSYTYVWYGATGYPGGAYRMYQGYGIHDTADVITGFQIENNESAGEFATGGQIKIYGIRIDS